MKSKIIRGVVTGACAVMILASVTACSKTVSSTETAEEVQVTEEAPAEAQDEAGADEVNPEDEAAAVQATLTFMGGLKTADDADKAIAVSMFRNEDGDIIYTYEEDGNLDYGMYTTETVKTEDGTEYAKIEGSIGTYGYYFNEDLVTGIIVDTTGKVYDAVELDEEGARAYVNKTIGG
ncbi:MAG: hypothetical protein IJ695_07670 [Butyrivibrio sp.]|nr:hypothetical protein [Butyrivibrio sp.]